MRKFLNGIRHFFEWLTVYAFLMNAVMLLIFPAPYEVAEGTFAALAASPVSLGIVAAVFAVLGVLLALSKFFKKKKLHTYTLFWTFIVLVYVTALEAVIGGGLLDLLDNAFLMLGVGYSYLRWKLQTEYLDIPTLQAEAVRIANERN